MTNPSTAEYWSNVEKCDLFNATELANLKQRFGDVTDAPLLARKFIVAGLFTNWQARFLLSGRHHLKVGQYILLERISGRIVGDRFLAIHKGLDRQVEVNLFPASVAKKAGLFQQFLSQASRVVGMDHRNLVHLYDIDREGTRYYFVYEHDTGTPLDRLVPGQIDVRTVADITRQILDGIGYAHQHKLIHGQLNETQVRIDEKNQIRISNVGLATMMDKLTQIDGQADNENGNRPLVDEDTAAAGRIGLKLLEQHAGDSLDDDHHQLQAIFCDISHVVKSDNRTNIEFIGTIDTWIRQHDVAHVSRERFTPLPVQVPDPPAQSPSRQETNGTTSRPSPAKRIGATADAPGSRGRLIGTIAGGIVALLLGGLAIYVYVSNGRLVSDLSQAKSLEEVANENMTGKPGVDAALTITPGKSRTSMLNGPDDSSERKSSLDEVTPESGNSSSPQETSLPKPQETPTSTPPESNPVASAVVGGTLNGLSVIDWKKAAEIEVTSADQIRLASELTSEPAAMADGTGSSTCGSTTGGSSTSVSGAVTVPFANLPPALAIPDFAGEDSTSTPVVLGEINTGDELLGMELIAPNGYGKKSLVFPIDRDTANVNRWEIRFAERVADVPVAVAEITKVDKELRFQWIAPAGTVNTINYLHNCLLRINSPTDSTTCVMRVAVEIEPIVFTNKKTNYRENLPVTFLPDGEFIFAELQQFSLADFPGQNSENGYEVSSRNPATEVYFHADALQRFLAIGFKLETGSQIKIESGLMQYSRSGFIAYRESTFKELGASVFGTQLDLQNKKLAADNYEPVYGEKTKHKDYIKELSKQLDLINLQVEGYKADAERVQKILDRPIHFRVMFKSDDVMIELARTKGWELIGNAPPVTESK